MKAIFIVLILFATNAAHAAIDAIEVFIPNVVASKSIHKLQFANTQYDFSSADAAPSFGILGVTAIRYFDQWELRSSLAYVASKIQGQLSAPGTWAGVTLTKQEFWQLEGRVTGGYNFDFDNFTVMPYFGLGIFTAENIASMTSTGFSGEDKIKLQKFYIPVLLGAQAKYKFGNWIPFLGLELQPFNILNKDNLGQEGGWSFINLDDELKDNLQFGNKFSYSINLGVRYVF